MERIVYREPRVFFFGSFELHTIRFDATKEGRALAYRTVISEIKRGRSASILTEGFSLFHMPEFIGLLASKNAPPLEVLLCSSKLSRTSEDAAEIDLIDNPLEIILQEIESGYPDPSKGKIAKEVVQEAINNKVLILRVIPEELRQSHSIIIDMIIDEKRLFLEQAHREGLIGKSWLLENSIYLVRKYENKHFQFRERATTLTVGK